MVDANSINGIPVIGTGVIGEVLTRTAAGWESKPKTWTPPTTPPPAPAGVKGWDITTTNTGPRAARTVYAGDHWSSDYSTSGTVAAPYSVTKKSFPGTIFQDTNHVKYVDCDFASTFQNKKYGVNATGTRFEYCLFSPGSGAAGAYGIGEVGYSLTRCQILGHSDGVRTNGANVIEESLIRVKIASVEDHNDGGQVYGGSGPAIYRANNIDLRPMAGQTIVYSNAAIQMGDYAPGTTFEGRIIDNLLHPGQGQYTLKLLDGGQTDGRNITYVVTGNRLHKGANGYLDRGNTPLSRITWANNVDAVTGAPIEIS